MGYILLDITADGRASLITCIRKDGNGMLLDSAPDVTSTTIAVVLESFGRTECVGKGE